MLDTTREARLREEVIVWLTTVRSDGQPQSVPVWFLWDGEYVEKYRESIARTYSVALQVTPDRWQVW